MPGLGPVELLIVAVFVLGTLAAVVGVVVTAVLAARGGRRGGEGGLEQRLRELDDLRARGVITPEEHAAARAQALRQ